MKQINFCHCLEYTYLTTVSALFHSLNYLILETVVFLLVDWPCSPFLVASASLGIKNSLQICLCKLVCPHRKCPSSTYTSLKPQAALLGHCLLVDPAHVVVQCSQKASHPHGKKPDKSFWLKVLKKVGWTIMARRLPKLDVLGCVFHSEAGVEVLIIASVQECWGSTGWPIKKYV